MQGRFAVLAAVLLLGGCLPQQPPRPSTAAPPSAASGDVGLPSPEGARRSDRTIAARGAVGVHTASGLALPPEASERPELPQMAAVEPPKTNVAPLPVPPAVRAKLVPPPPPPAPAPVASPPPATPPPPVSESVAPEPIVPGSAAVPSAAPASAERAMPAQAAAPTTAPATAPVAPVLAPSDPPLVAVHFAPGSADLSDGARLVLELFAREPATQRLRRIELWGWASNEDPVEARKIAFASVLTVHAYLIDQGIKARIDIAGFAETHDNSPNRVELRAGR